MDDNIGERIKSKSGVDLFRELLRQLPLVCLEDYYKNGVWQNDLMRLDIQILAAHRLEAGAPDPPPLSQVKVPDIPAAAPKAAQVLPSLLNPAALSMSSFQRPVLPGSLRAIMPGGAVARPVGAMVPGTLRPVAAPATSPALFAAAAKAAAALASPSPAGAVAPTQASAAQAALPKSMLAPPQDKAAAAQAALPKSIPGLPPPQDKSASLKRPFPGAPGLPPGKVARTVGPGGSLQVLSVGGAS